MYAHLYVYTYKYILYLVKPSTSFMILPIQYAITCNSHGENFLKGKHTHITSKISELRFESFQVQQDEKGSK